MADRIIRETEGGVALVKPVGSIFDPRTLGDGDVIAATKQVTNPSGLTQFRITLPSGREVESEWLREEQLKKALLPWIETIKAELLADAEEVRAIARRESEEKKARMGHALVSPLGDVLTAEPAPSSPSIVKAPARSLQPSTTPVGHNSATTVDLVSDPSAFIMVALDRARGEFRAAEERVQAAMMDLVEARTNLDKWTKLAEVIAPKEHINAEKSTSLSAAGPAGDSGSTRRRGRPVGSRNKPKPEGIPPAGTTPDTA